MVMIIFAESLWHHDMNVSIIVQTLTSHSRAPEGFAQRTFIPYANTFGESFVQGRVVQVDTVKQLVVLEGGQVRKHGVWSVLNGNLCMTWTCRVSCRRSTTPTSSCAPGPMERFRGSSTPWQRIRPPSRHTMTWSSRYDNWGSSGRRLVRNPSVTVTLSADSGCGVGARGWRRVNRGGDGCWDQDRVSRQKGEDRLTSGQSAAGHRLTPDLPSV